MAYNQIAPQQIRNEFRLALFGCNHELADYNNGRDSIAEGFKALSFNGILCNLAFMHGDYSSHQEPIETPTHDSDGTRVASKLNSLSINRHNVYSVLGNHDWGKLNCNWFRKWIDTFGENTASSGVNNSLRPYPIIRNGTEVDHYAIIVRNNLFLMIGDYNGVDSPIGRNSLVDGGYPSGAMSRKAWDFMKAQIALHPTKNVFVHAHHLLKDTTIATGDNEGFNGNFHGTSGKQISSGRLDDIYDDSNQTSVSADEIITWMDNNSGKIFMWCGSHSHVEINQTYAGRGQYISKHGTHFLNVGALSRYHAGRDSLARIMLFQNGSTELNIFQYVSYSATVSADQLYRANDLVLTMPYAF
jgi:hypothetical protein